MLAGKSFAKTNTDIFVVVMCSGSQIESVGPPILGLSIPACTYPPPESKGSGGQASARG